MTRPSPVAGPDPSDTTHRLFSLSLAKSQPEKSEATSDNEGDPAHPHRYRPVPDDDGPFRKNSHQVQQRNHGKDQPSHQRKCFWSIANQLNRWRTLVGVTTSSSSFVAIRYGSELLNRTSTQVGVS